MPQRADHPWKRRNFYDEPSHWTRQRKAARLAHRYVTRQQWCRDELQRLAVEAEHVEELSVDQIDALADSVERAARRLRKLADESYAVERLLANAGGYSLAKYLVEIENRSGR